MQIQKGLVKYKDRSDLTCTYAVTDDGKQYYFLDGYELSNGNIIATTALVEAIDPLAVAGSIGLIDAEGKEVIPFSNKMIKPIADDVLLVEKATPVTESVIEAVKLRSDPLAATRLVTTPATIKDKMNAKMGNDGRFIFNDQFSEATICDFNGNNLIDGELYSFIGITRDKLYFSKNTPDSSVFEYSLMPVNVQADNGSIPKLDVEDTAISRDDIKNAIDSQMMEQEKVLVKDNNTSFDNKLEEQVMEKATSEVDAVKKNVAVDALDITTGLVGEAETGEDKKTDTPIDGEEKKEEIASENILEEKPVEQKLEATVNGEKNDEGLVNESIDSVDAEKAEDKILDDTLEESEDIIGTNEDLVIDLNDAEAKNEKSLVTQDVVAEDTTESVNLFEPTDENKDSSVDLFASAIETDGKVDEDTDMEVPFDSVLHEDSILAGSSLDEYETSYQPTETVRDTIIEDTAITMSNLIKLNRSQMRKIDSCEEQISQLNSAGKKLAQKSKQQALEIEMLKNKVVSYETIVSKLETKNQILDNKVNDQERIISTQRDELNALRPQVAGKKELVKLLEDAQSLLGTDKYALDSDEVYSKRRVA